ncbi:MAG: hypothetical protein RLZZ502_1455, partial [Pseudomonadota bacterium]
MSRTFYKNTNSGLFCFLGILALSHSPAAWAQKFVKAAAGVTHVLAIREDGNVWAWGNNEAGQLGDGTTASKSAPQLVVGLTGVVEVAAGGEHSLALTRDGKVWSWGSNSSGQLGDGSQSFRVAPLPIAALPTIVEISVGWDHSLARAADGSVYAWGLNYYGNLGDGTFQSQATPVKVSNLSDIVEIKAGHYHSVARGRDGRVWLWGRNEFGQLGNGSKDSNTGTPLPQVLANLSNVVEIAAGRGHTLARTNAGEVWGWGWNLQGQLADGSSTDRLVPQKLPAVPNPVQLAAGWSMTAIRSADGSVWLGDGNGGAPSTSTGFLRLNRHPSLTDIKHVALGYIFSIAVDGQGKLSAWGKNDQGQLGDAATIARPMLQNVSGVNGVTAVAEVAAGDFYSMVRTQKGELITWGSNQQNELGRPIASDSTPVPGVVPNIPPVQQISAGSRRYHNWNFHSLATTTTGQVLAWGDNFFGQLGDGTSTYKATPITVPGLSNMVETMAGGWAFSLARNSAGQVWAWGSNNTGTLGDGSTSNKLSPVPIMSLSNVAQLAAGDSFSLALKSDGTVASWGNNYLGQLGLGNTSYKTSPENISGLSNIAEIAAGFAHGLARSRDGQVWAWGANGSAQLGDGSIINRLSPVLVPGLKQVVEIAAGDFYSLARTADGTVYGWGNLGRGQLGTGIGSLSTKPTPNPYVSILGAGKKMAAGNGHMLLLGDNGSVLAAGGNSHGQLAILGPQDNNTPKTIIDLQFPGNNRGAYPVTEFYNEQIRNSAGQTGQGHYFITNSFLEANGIDAGTAGAGWTRTGRSWRAWANAADVPAGTAAVPVYRFYAAGPNSHFYTASESEKNTLLAQNPTRDVSKGWALEGPVFHALIPTSAATSTVSGCPANSYPVYRSFNNRGTTVGKNDANHRITSDYIDNLRGIRYFGWQNEGVAFCAPTATVSGGDLHAYHSYPGDTVQAGSLMVSEHFFSNGGPGHAHGTTIYAAFDPKANWTWSCEAKFGAVCPSLPTGSTANLDLKLGLKVATFPAGGVLVLKGIANAPTGLNLGTTLSFASSITPPSGAADPHSLNNASVAASKTVVLNPSDCTVNFSNFNIEINHLAQSSQVNLLTPPLCAWTISSNQAHVSVSPSAG